MNFITTNCYGELCDYKFDGKSLPPEGIIHTPTESVGDLFRLCEKTENPPNYILVSSESDYGIFYQRENHPNEDLPKLLSKINFQEIINKALLSEDYYSVWLAPFTRKCNNTHEFSIKVDSYTIDTFDRIPTNIKRWYSTNLNVVEDVCRLLPFGMLEGSGFEYIKTIKKKPLNEKLDKIYVNFQNYTIERSQLNNFYKNQDFATHKFGISNEEYLNDINDHKFVLCPSGNGLDCYRIYETLMLGSIPIVQSSRFTTKMLKELELPVYIVEGLFMNKEGFKIGLDGYYSNNIESIYNAFDLEKLSKEFWKSELKEAKRLL